MADTQEEKIKFLIKEKGFGIDEAIQKMEISKQTFYNNIRKDPISATFKAILKEKLGIDLEKSLTNQKKLPSEILESMPTVLELQLKIEKLLDRITGEQQLRINDKDEVIRLQKEIDRLKDKYERKSS